VSRSGSCKFILEVKRVIAAEKAEEAEEAEAAVAKPLWLERTQETNPLKEKFGEQEVKEGLYLEKMRTLVIGNRCTFLSGKCS
jgi:hypothetical protein